jgi:3,4-dihydroxy 2-butanone 4-phosphate synthase / GTP cyclohydrolase II
MNASTSIETAIEAVRNGRMIVLCDDREKENDGDVVLAAEKVTADSINFMAKNCRGLICLALDSEFCERLDLPLMSSRRHSERCEAFTVSIEAREGVSTGISAADRARTILAAVMPNAKAEDLVRPGHIFPIKVKDGGVLSRAGQVEGSVDIMRLAGLKPAAVICKILDDEGKIASMPHLEKFALQHGMLMTTVADVISFRLQTESFAERGAETDLLTPSGEFKAVCFTNKLDNVTHLALIKGELSSDKEIMVRVHRECLVGDVFFSSHCKCAEQLRRAMSMISEEGLGIILYLRNAAGPLCLCSRLTSFKYGNKGIDTDQVNDISTEHTSLINYGVGAQMLVKLGVRKVRVLADKPRKIVAVKGYNLDIVEEVPLK